MNCATLESGTPADPKQLHHALSRVTCHAPKPPCRGVSPLNAAEHVHAASQPLCGRQCLESVEASS